MPEPGSSGTRVTKTSFRGSDRVASLGASKAASKRASFVASPNEVASSPPFGASAAPSGGFYALVCDGMGGEAGGAIASTLAVGTIAGALRARWLERNAEPRGWVALDEESIARALVASLEAASVRIK